MAGQFDQAVSNSLKALDLDRNFHGARRQLGFCHLLSGKTTEALAEFQTLVQWMPDSPVDQANLGWAYGLTGRRAEALQVLAVLEEMTRNRYVSPCQRALVHVGLAQTADALREVKQACQEHDGWIFMLMVDPMLAPLRNEPDFRVLLKKLGHVK
jgi:Flp pilus assembly protein TadD